MVKAVIFDLDDTLISEMEYIKSGYKRVAEVLEQKYGLPHEACYNDLLSLFDDNSKEVFNRILTRYEIDYTPEVILEIINEYRQHYPNITYFKDVKPCLQKLKDCEVLTGIITDGYAIGQRQKLSALNAELLFDEIVVTDELGRDYWKPHPKAYELISERLNVPFDQMIYVGDNPEKDFYISSIYPIRTIRIHRMGVHRNKEYLGNIMEHSSCNDLMEIMKYVM